MFPAPARPLGFGFPFFRPCRIISSISSGEYLPDPSPICTGIGLSESNALALSQSGQFVVKVEAAMLVVYEWSGKGMTVTWKRRCQLQAPDGYTFRTSERDWGLGAGGWGLVWNTME